jgi:DNA-directed RNA polymerase subunit RPC12/RpoP
MTTSPPPQSLSAITADLFCANCAYNMRGQNVFIEPTTKLQVIRCPECGAYHPIQFLGTTRRWHLWSDKALMLFAILWSAGITCATLAALFIEFLATLAFQAVVTSSYSNPQAFIFPSLMLLVSPTANGMLIAAATTSPNYKRRLALVLARWSLYAVAILTALVAYYRYSNNEVLPALFLLPIAIHGILSLIGVLLGRPIALLLCRSFLPKSLQPYALSYWGLPPDPETAPSLTSTPSPAPNSSSL